MEKYCVAELREACKNRSVPIKNSDGSMKVKKDLIKSLQKYVSQKQLGGARKRSSRRRSRRKSSRKTRSRSRRKYSRKSRRKSSRKLSRKSRRKSRRKSSRKTRRRSRRKSMTGGAAQPEVVAAQPAVVTQPVVVASPPPEVGAVQAVQAVLVPGAVQELARPERPSLPVLLEEDEKKFLQLLFTNIYSKDQGYIPTYFQRSWNPVDIREVKELEELEEVLPVPTDAAKRINFNTLYHQIYGRTVFSSLSLSQRAPFLLIFFNDKLSKLKGKEKDKQTLQIQIRLICNCLFIYITNLKHICMYFLKTEATMHPIIRAAIEECEKLTANFLSNPNLTNITALRTFCNNKKDIERQASQITIQKMDVIFIICALYPYQHKEDRVSSIVVDYLFEVLNILIRNNKHTFQTLVEFNPAK